MKCSRRQSTRERERVQINIFFKETKLSSSYKCNQNQNCTSQLCLALLHIKQKNLWLSDCTFSKEQIASVSKILHSLFHRRRRRRRRFQWPTNYILCIYKVLQSYKDLLYYTVQVYLYNFWRLKISMHISTLERSFEVSRDVQIFLWLTVWGI